MISRPRVPSPLFALGVSVVAVAAALAQAPAPDVISVQAARPAADVSKTMFGVFFEDINFAADGGLYPERIKNRSFEFDEPLAGWARRERKGADGELTVGTDRPLNPDNPHYLRIRVHEAGEGFTVLNSGFRGIGLEAGAEYIVSAWARRVGAGPQALRAAVIDERGEVIGEAALGGFTGEWKRYEATIAPSATAARAQFRIVIEQAGDVDLDMVSLVPKDTWKGRPNGLRKDLVQLLADLKPGFLRFPGGCIVEGRRLELRYQWKKTVGDLAARRVIINRWADENERMAPDYYQSFGLGFYEYFQLAEDIGASPLPILNCGMACQFNSGEMAPLDRLDEYIQDALDLVEFANGPESSRWGGLRARMGHPGPFGLTMVGVGNEQWGARYVERYERFAAVLKAKHPEIQIVSSAGPFARGEQFEFLWGKLRGMKADLVDEHYYMPPAWFLENATRYDEYDRTGPKVFAGEYAAHVRGAAGPSRSTWQAALAEAAFMTGLERNADVVRMAAYAPLFAHVDAWQWSPNLIWFDNLRAYGTPSYHVQKLFGTNAGTKILPVAINGAVAAAQNGLYASAALDERANEIVVKVVNVDPKGRTVRLALEGAAPMGVGRRIEMWSADLQAENTLDRPARVAPAESPIALDGPDLRLDLPPQSVTVLRAPRGTVAHGQAAPCQALKEWTTAEDHRQMMGQLAIRALRPGPSGNDKDPNHANYDEALANPFPNLPGLLTLKGGRRVTDAAGWAERRKEIVEEFEREVVGRIPPGVPKVTWSVTERQDGVIGGMRVTGKQVIGRVDNSGCPAIAVEIQFTLVTPSDLSTPAPVMIMFRGGGLGQALGTAPPPAGPPRFTPPPGALGYDPPAAEQLLAAGWGFAYLNPSSIQADNGAGLTRGIIGLVNKGQPRKPDDWGSLRAWSWGAARALDYLESDPAVDAKRVGIEGVSRYGKAALITMAFEPRFAVALVGSSGEGGAKLHRRNFGEAVENLTGSGEYHWMAGNFLKYGASDAAFGSRNAGDIPVDAHQLIALCAPRPTFISYGVPEMGDAKWLDQQGSFMAAVAAGPAFRLLGVKDLGTSDDYRTEKMPPVNVGLLDGHLAWRQHDGGHTDAPNWKWFIPWANRLLGWQRPARTWPADAPSPRWDANSLVAHQQLLAKAKAGRIDVYFLGDSITRRWGATDYPELLANWKQNFFGWNAANFGWGADRTENILWRLEHGELDGVNPKVVVVLAGTNNVGGAPGDDAKVEEITRGLRAILDACRRKAPAATIVLTAIFPRNDTMTVGPEIARINANLAKMADGQAVRYLDVNRKLADANGRLFPGTMGDGLHPTVKGYQVWADALKPILTELLGPPAATDQSPPPTGDPSKRQ